MLYARLGTIIFLLFYTLLLGAQSEYRQIDHYLQLIGAEYSGDRAFETTKYVSEHWRLPGNPGFDSSIYYVQRILEQAGFIASQKPDHQRLTYRIEKSAMRLPAWEPVNAQLEIIGEKVALLQFSNNRNMVAINSFSTPEEGMEAEVVYLPECNEAGIHGLDVKGKIVFSECRSRSLFSLAVNKYGAAGVLAYRIPAYNQPEKYQHSISFSSIPFNSEHQSWAINLSYSAKERLLAALKKGTVRVKATIETKFQAAEELTLIAEIPGQIRPDERFVFSAHVQEPGANDNASGVGAQAEMARVAAKLVLEGKEKPARSITFIWGDEIDATRRYIQMDEARAMRIRWGMSLDMVGEDTEKTGGTFLIEKMPDPSAIWTRGEDQHTEWGASPVRKDRLKPHYFNDIIEAVCRRQAMGTGWVVKTNPFEGGSDHQPFLDVGIPGILLWHFTDVFYHTDADCIDKVSPATLKNVGSSALASALLLCNGLEATAKDVLNISKAAAHRRIDAELKLSKKAIASGKSVEDETEIVQTWVDWYTKALPKVGDIVVEEPSRELEKKIERAVVEISKKGSDGLEDLKK